MRQPSLLCRHFWQLTFHDGLIAQSPFHDSFFGGLPYMPVSSISRPFIQSLWAAAFSAKAFLQSPVFSAILWTPYYFAPCVLASLPPVQPSCVVSYPAAFLWAFLLRAAPVRLDGPPKVRRGILGGGTSCFRVPLSLPWENVFSSSSYALFVPPFPPPARFGRPFFLQAVFLRGYYFYLFIAAGFLHRHPA